MDMKRLKTSMWTLLTESPEKSREVNYTDMGFTAKLCKKMAERCM